jgi:TRAP-type mannitol/chloroaromatic compound transport system permease small subunit
MSHPMQNNVLNKRALRGWHYPSTLQSWLAKHTLMITVCSLVQGLSKVMKTIKVLRGIVESGC